MPNMLNTKVKQLPMQDLSQCRNRVLHHFASRTRVDIGIPARLSRSLLEPDKCCWLIHWLFALCTDICAIDYQYDTRSVQISRSYCHERDRCGDFWCNTLAGAVANSPPD